MKKYKISFDEAFQRYVDDNEIILIEKPSQLRKSGYERQQNNINKCNFLLPGNIN